MAAGDESVTQEQIDECWRALMESMQYLSFLQGDKSDLEKVIEFASDAEEKLDSYVETGKAEFIQVLEEARAVYSDADAMQEEVDSAWMTLLEKTADLRLKADKGALEDLIDEAASMDLSAYTEESAAAFHAAFANARSVLADDTLSEDDQYVVDEAAAQLAAARDALIVKDDAEDASEPTEPADPSGSGGAQKSGTAGEAGSNNEEQPGAKAGNSVPVTGDRSVWAVFMVLCLISGVCAVYLSRRRNN